MSYFNMTTANNQQTLKLGDMQKLNTNFEVTVPRSNNTLKTQHLTGCLATKKADKKAFGDLI